ncbi:hypothetical protein SFA35_25840 (plasmid) [Pseudomonas sp. HR96]|uniref:hypothetical protein n=1 Tax=Pseudomonas sp. HR96 TaxID=1027966 RepID=UPI002A760A47|nr:hypothetical protein [Pseudomonas sp. HR96]WPP02417.1 hypothetical protein SFA35_25840 [Pseudomonas sp. HR96]
MTPMTSNAQESMLAMMADRYVLYPQRVRYFFYVCKDRLDGRSRVALVKRLDHLLEVALSQNQAWHSHFSALLLKAVELGALHSTDHDFLLGQLERCVADRGEKPREPKGRRIGAGLSRH